MMNRRNILSSLAAVAVGAKLVGTGAAFGQDTSAPKRKIPWRNWSGSQECFPDARKAPATVSELQELVLNASGTVKAVGAGHSFSPLVPTDGTIISLSRMAGVVSHDSGKMEAVIRAGTRLGAIGAPLAERGQAMINMPDIDEQSLAGALGTATHGTGAGIGCLPTFVEGMQIVTASGDVIECDRQRNSHIFEAARVNLGAIGIVTEVRLKNTAQYKLKREMAWGPIEEILEAAETTADNNRNFEFYYVPFSGMGFSDVQNITNEPITVQGHPDQNDGAETLRSVRDWFSWSSKLRELLLSSEISDIEDTMMVKNAWQSYATERNVRFNEMEYHLPRENGLQAFREVRKLVEDDFPEVFFPFEVRFVKSDDIWLSPFNGRETISIAVHRYFKEDFKAMFAAVEPIFKKYGGRPHWGKINTMTGDEAAGHYGYWRDFEAVRREMDPGGKFLNPYLKTLFGTA